MGRHISDIRTSAWKYITYIHRLEYVILLDTYGRRHPVTTGFQLRKTTAAEDHNFKVISKG